MSSECEKYRYIYSQVYCFECNPDVTYGNNFAPEPDPEDAYNLMRNNKKSKGDDEDPDKSNSTFQLL